MLHDEVDLAAIGQRYARQLAAKDEVIAALCRRAGAAEQARDRCRAALAAMAAGAAPAAPGGDRLIAAPAAPRRAGRVPVGAWHTSVAVYRVAPGSAERLLQRLRWRLLPRFRRRPGYLGGQLLAPDAETALVVGLWASRSEAEWAARAVEALLAGPACAMVASSATRVAALAPADAGEPGWADAAAHAGADVHARPVAPGRRQRAPTAD